MGCGETSILGGFTWGSHKRIHTGWFSTHSGEGRSSFKFFHVLHMQPHAAEIAAPEGQVGRGVDFAADGGAGVDEFVFCRGDVGCCGNGQHVQRFVAHAEARDGFHP